MCLQEQIVPLQFVLQFTFQAKSKRYAIVVINRFLLLNAWYYSFFTFNFFFLMMPPSMMSAMDYAYKICFWKRVQQKGCVWLTKNRKEVVNGRIYAGVENF